MLKGSIVLGFIVVAFIGLPLLDSLGPQSCKVERNIAISGRDGLWRVCHGTRLNITVSEHFIRYTD